jgi:hypothetical protein
LEPILTENRDSDVVLFNEGESQLFEDDEENVRESGIMKRKPHSYIKTHNNFKKFANKNIENHNQIQEIDQMLQHIRCSLIAKDPHEIKGEGELSRYGERIYLGNNRVSVVRESEGFQGIDHIIDEVYSKITNKLNKKHCVIF